MSTYATTKPRALSLSNKALPNHQDSPIVVVEKELCDNESCGPKIEVLPIAIDVVLGTDVLYTGAKLSRNFK